MRVWAGFLIFCSFSGTLVSSRVDAKMLPVPLVRQSTEYSCGAAALLAVLAYYGDLRWNESDIMAKAGTTTEGTELAKMTATANDLGLKARWQDGATLAQLRESVAKKNPVIIAAQAWAEEPRENYSEVWDQGHYLVVVDIDDEKVYFMDPAHLGSHGYWTIAEFLERWHDTSTGDVRYHHLAFFPEGTPKPPTPLLPVP